MTDFDLITLNLWVLPIADITRDFAILTVQMSECQFFLYLERVRQVEDQCVDIKTGRNPNGRVELQRSIAMNGWL